MPWRMGAVIIGFAGLVTLGPAAVAADAAPAGQDALFLQQAHQVNLAEISAGQLAQQKGNTPVVKKIGARLAADHRTLDKPVQLTAHALGVALPNTPDEQQRAVAQQLQHASGAAFDRVFVTTQLTGHQQALAAGQAELAHGHDARVTALARTAAPVIEAHRQMLHSAASALGIPS
jgi:putative membrane protein